MTDLAANLTAVRERIAAAAARSNRRTEDITLVAVSKTRSVEEIAAAVESGVLDLGENYVQELVAKAEQLRGVTGAPVRWHFIGHLQRNKVKYLSGLCTLIHSLDSPRLAEEIARRAVPPADPQPVLIQVDLAGEATKSGCPEDQVPALVETVLGLPELDWQGLMTITPYAEDPESSRPYYRRLAALRDALAARGVPARNLRHLSMGMSNDYEVAIEEGATLVRVGTAIFGPRQ
ncbi:MAG: YggS family pyridoxal phosphate-dependent enzyme [Armatimonadetes bacterium]|nr:YggS family pyridoxal phosphate-dependent enzyme [Armatimonadota bacterium]